METRPPRPRLPLQGPGAVSPRPRVPSQGGLWRRPGPGVPGGGRSKGGPSTKGLMAGRGPQRGPGRAVAVAVAITSLGLWAPAALAKGSSEPFTPRGGNPAPHRSRFQSRSHSPPRLLPQPSHHPRAGVRCGVPRNPDVPPKLLSAPQITLCPPKPRACRARARLFPAARCPALPGVIEAPALPGRVPENALFFLVGFTRDHPTARSAQPPHP